MKIITAILERAVRLLALVGSIGVLALMIQICLDVLMRAFWGTPIPATVEVASKYYMVLIAFLPLAWVEHNDGMISIGFLDDLLPRWALRMSNFLVAGIVSLTYLVLTWITWLTAMKNFNLGTFVIVLNEKLLIWPSYFLLPIGFALAMAATAFRAFRIVFDPKHP